MGGKILFLFCVLGFHTIARSYERTTIVACSLSLHSLNQQDRPPLDDGAMKQIVEELVSLQTSHLPDPQLGPHRNKNSAERRFLIDSLIHDKIADLQRRFSPEALQAITLEVKKQVHGRLRQSLQQIPPPPDLSKEEKTLGTIKVPMSPLKLIHLRKQKSATFSTDGQQLMTVSYLEDIPTFWNAHTGELLHEVRKDRAFAKTISASPTGRHWLTKGFHRVFLWNLSDNSLYRELNFLDAPFLSAEFSPDGTHVAANTQGHLFVWSLDPKSMITHIEGYSIAPLTKTSFSPDGARLVFISNDDPVLRSRRLVVWSITEDEEVFSLEESNSRFIESAAFTPDGRYIIVLPEDGEYGRIYRASDGRLLNRFGDPETLTYRWANALAFSPDSQFMATGMALPINRQSIKIWRISDGSLVSTINNRGGYPNKLEFSPDGKKLAVSTINNEVEVWSIFETLNTLRNLSDQDR